MRRRRGRLKTLLLFGMILLLLGAAAGSAWTAFSADSSLKSASLAFAGIFLGLFGVLLLIDMLQADRDDLMDEYYGVGGKAGKYVRHQVGHKLGWTYHPKTDTDPRR